MKYQADRCLIARAENACWNCATVGQVVCLVLPYNLVATEEGPEDSPPPFEGAAAMTYIQQIDPDLLAAINLPGFRHGASHTAGMSYYGNHCEHCGSLTGDHFLHHLDGPFWPNPQASRAVSLSLYDRPMTILANGWSSLCFPLLGYEPAFEGPLPDTAVVCDDRIDAVRPCAAELSRMKNTALVAGLGAPPVPRLTDITEFRIPAGKVYLSPMTDCHDGLVVSWSISTRPDAKLVNTMLDTAIETVPAAAIRLWCIRIVAATTRGLAGHHKSLRPSSSAPCRAKRARNPSTRCPASLRRPTSPGIPGRLASESPTDFVGTRK